MDLNKLKVPELRKELQSRGLDSKGNKPVLIERLREAMEQENENKEEEEDSEKEEVTESSEENSLMYTTAESATAEPPDAEVEADTSQEERAFSVITSAASAESDASPVDSDDQQQQLDTDETNLSVPAVEQSTELAKTEDADSVQETCDSDSLPQTTNDDLQDTFGEQESEQIETRHNVDQTQSTMDQDQSTFDQGQSNDSSRSYSNSTFQETSETDVIPKSKEEVRNLNEETMDVPASQGSWSQDDRNTFSGQNFITHKDDDDSTEERTHEAESTPMEQDSAAPEEEANDQKTAADEAAEGEPAAASEGPSETPEPSETTPQEPVETQEQKKRTRRSRFDQLEDRNNAMEQGEDAENSRRNEDRKRRLSSPSGQDGVWGDGPAIKYAKPDDDEPSFADEDVLLSWYDSDLNLTISKENFVSAVPIHEQGFVYMWAGARSTYGFQSGKIYYDVKLTEKLAVDVNEEFAVHSFRLGWSVAYSSLQLGEVPLSYGYDSSGKKCVDNNFEDYGQPFNAEDIIGCLVDFDSNAENVLISYTLNGVSQGVAFELAKEQLENKALFPHVLSKNFSFETNFGEREDGWSLENKFEGDFVWASKVPLENRVKGPRKPEEKKQCEVVMLCGLPCSGKTTWIRKHSQENPEKMFYVIGIDFVLQKMKLQSESIETHFKDKENSNVLVERCTKCVNRLQEIACTRWRHYILDQCNTFLAIQRRKMRSFEGFTRIAVVTLPKEEEYEKYLEKWDENGVRETSISLLELKSNFRLPEEGELFEQIIFEGTTREEAEELIKKYNKEGRDARQRDDRGYNRGSYHRDDRYGGRQMGGANQYRSRWVDRGPPSMGRGGGGGSWGPPRGGMDRMGPGSFRDRRNWRDRDDDRDNYRGGRYGGGGGGGGGGHRDQGGRFGGNAMGGGGGRWGGNRDRDRMGGPPVSRSHGGPSGSGPNPLMGSLVGKPTGGPMGYGGERKSRFDDKRGDGDDFDRFARVGPPGVDQEGDDSMDKGGGRFGDGGGFRGGRGGFRGGRGGGPPDRSGDRNMGGGGGGRFGGNQFRPDNRGGMRGSGGFNRNRDDGGGGGRFYGGRGGGGGGGGGGPPGRDGRDNRNPMNSQRGGGGGGPGGGGGMNSRFDKRDGGKGNNGNKNEPNAGNQPPQQGNWGGMYGQQQANWNQQYQQWAQYQQAAGYNPQQLQQYWAQMQQQQQQQQQQQPQNSASAQPGQQQTSKTGAPANMASAPPNTSAKSSSSNTSSAQQSGSNTGYSTQGYSTQGYNQQGYDANAYAQYCAYYTQLAAQQGWPQNADGTYTYPQNAWAQYAGYNYNAAAGAGAGGPNAAGSAATANTGTSSASTEKSAVTSK